VGSAGTGEEIAPIDEEFQHHLAVATERLAGGDTEGAREPLRRAAARLPEDGTALGLLGQACYRAGLFDEAAAAYGRLVDDNPAEVSSRVNLKFDGLVKSPSVPLRSGIALQLRRCGR